MSARVDVRAWLAQRTIPPTSVHWTTAEIADLDATFRLLTLNQNTTNLPPVPTRAPINYSYALHPAISDVSSGESKVYWEANVSGLMSALDYNQHQHDLNVPDLARYFSDTRVDDSQKMLMHMALLIPNFHLGPLLTPSTIQSISKAVQDIQIPEDDNDSGRVVKQYKDIASLCLESRYPPTVQGRSRQEVVQMTKTDASVISALERVAELYAAAADADDVESSDDGILTPSTTAVAVSEVGTVIPTPPESIV